MQAMEYERPASSDLAIKSAAHDTSSFLAGGTTLLDLMKLDVMHPTRVIDISQLDGDLNTVRSTTQSFRIGSLVRMGDAIDHPALRRELPVLVQSLELAASQQLRNMATLGGNVLQRTRCTYFRDVSWQSCNKRNPGSGCAALEGINRTHAVLGVSDQCIATYPGDFAQALIALDASVDLQGPCGRRTIPFATLHTLPGEHPEIETTLQPAELILAFTIPRADWLKRSLYLKVRDRKSYEFALASTAVALNLDAHKVSEARIALGGVASVPWRARQAELSLVGKSLDEVTAGAAADVAFDGAQVREHNGYKVLLGKQTLVRALLAARDLDVA